MGNNKSSNNSSIDLINTSIPANDDIFKVDNINSYGRKHASAKLQVSNEHLCIKQKHRQSLHIPLETIKRYGLDGSIFLLECGRHAPLGQARYAFRCKQAGRIVNCLDQRITLRSKQLLEQQRQESAISSSSTLTNVTTTSHQRHHHRRRRTHSDQGLTQRASSLVRFSSTSSSTISLTSRVTFLYRNSEPNLSENYFDFDTHPHCTESSHPDDRQFRARLKQPVERESIPELNYVEFKAESTPISTDEHEVEIPISTIEPDNQSPTESPVEESHKRVLSSFFNHHHQQQQQKSSKTSGNNASTTADSASKTSSSVTAPYVYIDHEKTVTLKDIANERLQQQKARRIET